MSTLNFVSCIVIGFTMAHSAEVNNNDGLVYPFLFVGRSQWGARSPIATEPLKTPVTYVVIHHSSTETGYCNNFKECSAAMRRMQDMHIDTFDWWDIGYQFAIGGDGVAYEGRGWDIMGAQAKYFNTVSIGICLIGNWTHFLPSTNQQKTLQKLIAYGVNLGYIKPDYRLVGHRQVRDTQCPGQKLFDEIKAWHHHSNFPASPLDLLDIPEIPESVKDEIRKNKARGIK